jgi:hypothetical protein
MPGALDLPVTDARRKLGRDSRYVYQMRYVRCQGVIR